MREAITAAIYPVAARGDHQKKSDLPCSSELVVPRVANN
jgi:hypothetical protein